MIPLKRVLWFKKGEGKKVRGEDGKFVWGKIKKRKAFHDLQFRMQREKEAK
jgi:hypothetical protein